MKRFLLFGCDVYYPLGGWEDFIKDFNTIFEAEEYINKLILFYKNLKSLGYDTFQIVDTTTLKIVKEIENE